MNPLLSDMGKRVRPFLVMQILGMAKEMERRGEDVVHLEIGEPDFDSPPHVSESAIRALMEGKTHYTPSEGIHELRAAIAEDMRNRYGVRVTHDRVVVTPGSSTAFLLLFLSLLKRGERVFMTDPGYPCYPNFAVIAGGKPSFIRLKEEEGWVIDPGRLRHARRRGGKLLIISSPANPTGSITPPEIYEEAMRLGFTVISDEIYHGLNFSGKRDFSALEMDDSSFVVSGVSKFYAMTGFRIGWIIAPGRFVPPLARLAQNLYLSAPTVSQYAALSALEGGREYPLSLRDKYRERRDIMLSHLKDAGFPPGREPEGAFYAFVNVSPFCSDSLTFSMRLLQEAHVATAPGIDFSAHLGKGYLRFSFTTGKERIIEGVRRIREFLKYPR